MGSSERKARKEDHKEPETGTPTLTFIAHLQRSLLGTAWSQLPRKYNERPASPSSQTVWDSSRTANSPANLKCKYMRDWTDNCTQPSNGNPCKYLGRCSDVCSQRKLPLEVFVLPYHLSHARVRINTGAEGHRQVLCSRLFTHTLSVPRSADASRYVPNSTNNWWRGRSNESWVAILKPKPLGIYTVFKKCAKVSFLKLP